MKKKFRYPSKAKAIFLPLFLLAMPVFAAELSYDRYAPIYEKGPESMSRRALLHFLTYPFELVRWPIDKGLYYMDEYSLDKKVRWAYDTLQSHGLTFRGNAVSLSEMGAGVDIDVLRVFQLKETFPDTRLNTWVDYTDDVKFEVGTEIGAERILDTGFRTAAYFQYDNRPREHFYGIGPATSPGDGSVYGMETTRFRGKFGYSPDPKFSLDGFAEYRNVNITDGKDGGRGQRGLHPTFPATLSGFSGDSIFSLGMELVHDTRNQKENSTAGGKRRIALSYNEGLNSSTARYMNYEMDFSQYFRLGSDRRVLAVRFHGEHNDELNNGQVPFHQMSKLGGYGMNKRLSDTMRGFEFNRFFDESAVLLNLEYRYTIWEYRELKIDTIIFFDEGQVFGEFSDFKTSDFRESYGLGFRASLANIVLMSIEMAHSDEGTQVYFKTHAPF